MFHILIKPKILQIFQKFLKYNSIISMNHMKNLIMMIHINLLIIHINQWKSKIHQNNDQNLINKIFLMIRINST